MCGTPWPNPALTQNFSPNGLVVLEMWKNMWFFPQFEKEGNFSFKNHIFCHISISTNPIGLKFCVSVEFSHRLPHTKFQPLRLKDAEDIGWCSWRGNGTFDSETSVVRINYSIFFSLPSVFLSGPIFAIIHALCNFWRIHFTSIIEWASIGAPRIRQLLRRTGNSL